MLLNLEARKVMISCPPLDWTVSCEIALICSIGSCLHEKAGMSQWEAHVTRACIIMMRGWS